MSKIGTLFDPGLIVASSNAARKVAQLPAPGVAGPGATDFVTDATAATFGSAVVGGGANKVPVWCDGATWKIG